MRKQGRKLPVPCCAPHKCGFGHLKTSLPKLYYKEKPFIQNLAQKRSVVQNSINTDTIVLFITCLLFLPPSYLYTTAASVCRDWVGGRHHQTLQKCWQLPIWKEQRLNSFLLPNPQPPPPQPVLGYLHPLTDITFGKKCSVRYFSSEQWPQHIHMHSLTEIALEILQTSALWNNLHSLKIKSVRANWLSVL